MEDLPENAEAIEALRDCFDKLSISALTALAAEEIFGKQLDTDDESLFLASIIDDTQVIQSELVAKLNMILDMHGLVDADRFSFQVFKRKAGYSGRDKRLPKSITRDPEDKSDPDLYELGSYCLAICLKDYQIVRFAGEEYMVQLERMTPLFEIRPHEKKPADRPSVPSNKTQVKFPNGRVTLKNRDYLSILVWAFWDGHPEKQDNIQMNTEPLQKVIEKLGKTSFEGFSPTQKSQSDEGIVIYDSVEEAKKERNM